MQYRFSDFELDLSQQELRRLGEAVHIEPQVFDLIVHLVRNHERIVSKDELIDTVWNGRIISEAALSSRINGARRALGDNGTDQLFIRTLHKRGFRFIGRSRIVGFDGELLADAPDEGERIIVATIDPEAARRKRVVKIPGEHEVDRVGHRRPEMYGPLLTPGEASRGR